MLSVYTIIHCNNFWIRLQNDTKNIEFLKIKRGLQYIAAKNFVSSPKSALDVVEAFNIENVWTQYGVSKDCDNPEHFYTASISDKDYSYFIFSSQKSIHLIRENISPTNRKFLIDATFKPVPRGCLNQLLIIYVEYFDEVQKMILCFTF